MYIIDSMPRRWLAIVLATILLSLIMPAQGWAEPALRTTSPIEVGIPKMVPVDAGVKKASIECTPTGRCITVWVEAPLGPLWMTLYERDSTSPPLATSYLGFPGQTMQYSVAYADGKFMVVWLHLNVALHAQIIDADTGATLDQPIELMNWRDHTRFEEAQRPDVTLVGVDGKFLAVWNLVETMGDREIVTVARWITHDGQLLGSLAEPYPRQMEHEIWDADFDGTHIRLLSEATPAEFGANTYETHVMSVDPATRTFDAPPKPIDAGIHPFKSNQGCLTNKTCLVVWRAGAGDEIHGGLLDSHGQWVWQPKLLMSVDATLSTPQVWADGDAFEVTVDETLVHVSADGQVSQPVQFELPADEALRVLDLARDPQAFRLLAADADDHLVELHLGADGQVVGRNDKITYKPNNIRAVELLSSQGRTMLIWSELYGAGVRIYATPVSVDGEPLAPDGVLIDEQLAVNGVTGYGDAHGFVVAWTTLAGRIVIQHLSVDGAELTLQSRLELDLDRIPVGDISIAPAGDLYVLAFDEGSDAAYSTNMQTVVIADASGESVSFRPFDFEGSLRGIACTDGPPRCVVAATGRRANSSLVRFASFPATDASEVPALTFDQLNSPTAQALRAPPGAVNGQIITAWRDTPAETSSPIELYEVKAGGELQHLSSIDGVDAVDVGTPFATAHGVAIPIVEADRSNGHSTDLVRLDAAFEQLDDTPITPIVEGLSVPMSAFAQREGGGMIAAVRVNPPDARYERHRLFVQALAIPGQAGQECRHDLDCAVGTCTGGTCRVEQDADAGAVDGGSQPVDGGAQESGDAHSDSGCSHVDVSNTTSFTSVLAMLLLLSILPRTRRTRR